MLTPLNQVVIWGSGLPPNTAPTKPNLCVCVVCVANAHFPDWSPRRAAKLHGTEGIVGRAGQRIDCVSGSTQRALECADDSGGASLFFGTMQICVVSVLASDALAHLFVFVANTHVPEM